MDSGVGRSELESETLMPSAYTGRHVVLLSPTLLAQVNLQHLPGPGPRNLFVPCSTGTGGANAELGHDSNKFTLLLQILD